MVTAPCRCQNQYMLLKSSAAIRRQLFAIEQGVCGECRLDTARLLLRMRGLRAAERLEVIYEAAPAWRATKQTQGAAERLARHTTAGAPR